MTGRPGPWELIVKYSGDLAGIVREKFPEAELKELSGGFGILTVPEEEVPGILELKEIEYAEKPKRLFFAINQAKAASCLTLVQQGPEGLTGRGVLVGILDSGIDYFHGDFRHEDGTSRILFLNDQVTGDVYTKEEIDEALGTGSREAARALVPSADPGGHGTAVAGIAAGNGRESGGRYRGVAYESDLVVVQSGNAGSGWISQDHTGDGGAGFSGKKIHGAGTSHGGERELRKLLWLP